MSLRHTGTGAPGACRACQCRAIARRSGRLIPAILLIVAVIGSIYAGLAQITPPVGFNLYILQALTGGDLVAITRASIPFFFLLLMSPVMLVLWPQTALYLPARIMMR